MAVLASSRVSMPYGNTAFGAELMRSYFTDRNSTLGEVVLQAKRRLLKRESSDPHRKMVENIAALFLPNQADRDRERFEHAQMYNLLGDPLLRLKHPEDLELAAPPSTAAGGMIRIAGKTPCSGTLRCEWTLPNDARLANGTVRRELRNDPDAEKHQTEQYESANATVLSTSSIDVGTGPFSEEVAVPELLPGRYVLRVHLAELDDWASSATHIDIASPRDANVPSSSTTN